MGVLILGEMRLHVLPPRALVRCTVTPMQYSTSCRRDRYERLYSAPAQQSTHTVLVLAGACFAESYALASGPEPTQRWHVRTLATRTDSGHAPVEPGPGASRWHPPTHRLDVVLTRFMKFCCGTGHEFFQPTVEREELRNTQPTWRVEPSPVPLRSDRPCHVVAAAHHEDQRQVLQGA